MNKKNEIVVEVLTTELLNEKKTASFIFNVIANSFPEIIPKKIGNFEPVSKSFNSIDDVLENWRSPFFWRTEKNRLEGNIWFNEHNNHSAIILRTTPKFFSTDKILSFISLTASNLSPDIAYIHLITQNEIHAKNINYKMWHSFELGLVTNDIKLGLPNLPWGMFFGEPYIELIGRDKLLKCPAYLAKQISNKLIFVQITPDINDIVNDFSKFEYKRNEIKEYLSSDLFYKQDGSFANLIPSFNLQ